MDFQQVAKRLEWLDEERRKDKNTIAALEERISFLESTNTQQLQHINELLSDVSRLQAIGGKLREYDSAMSQIRIDFSGSVDSIEKQRAERERDSDRIRQEDIEQVQKLAQENRILHEKTDDLKKDSLFRKEEFITLSRSIEEIKKSVEDSIRQGDEFRRLQNLLEDRRRTESKRMADMQGELSALRKRTEEQRGKQDIYSETLRKTDQKITEMVNAESERRQLQNAFIEKTNIANIERDRLWKDWQTRFEDIDRKSALVDTQIQALDGTFRMVKRSQESLDEVTQKFERRINEITEMQRLGEERFRNEWAGFKADDQKRWANITLNLDEAQRESARQLQKTSERLSLIDDSVKDIQYQLAQMMESENKRLVALYNIIHQWMINEDTN